MAAIRSGVSRKRSTAASDSPYSGALPMSMRLASAKAADRSASNRAERYSHSRFCAPVALTNSSAACLARWATLRQY